MLKKTIKNIFKFMWWLLLYLWQLPQNLLGLIILLFVTNKTKKTNYGITYYNAPNFPGGISLGKYIIHYSNSEYNIKHEYGHCTQSKILGPLYLLIIGLPSITHCMINDKIKCCINHKTGYYHFWTEKWANKLVNLK